MHTDEVFLRCEYEIEGLSTRKDTFGIPLGEAVMIRKGHQFGAGIMMLDVLHEVLWIGNAGEHERSALHTHLLITYAGEVKLHIGRQAEVVVHHASVDRLKVVRTVGHNDSVGLKHTLFEVAQPSPWQHMVVLV